MPRLAISALALLLSTAAFAVGTRMALPRELSPSDDKSVENRDVWDFSQFSTLDDRCVFFARIVGDEIYEQLDDCCRAYWLRNDTAFFRGYNVGRNERMLVDSLLPAAVFPLDKGNGFNDGYTARGDINMDIATFERGIHRAGIVACGTAIVDADTIPGVLLHKEVFKYTKGFADDPGLNDTELTCILYRWFAPGARLPFAVQRRDNGAEPRLFIASSDDILSAIENTVRTASEAGPSDDYIMSVLQSATVSQNAHEINVRALSSEGGHSIDIDVYLLDVTGNAYSHAEGSLPAIDGINLAVPSHLSGQFIVAVCMRDNPELNHKIFVYL